MITCRIWVNESLCVTQVWMKGIQCDQTLELKSSPIFTKVAQKGAKAVFCALREVLK